MCVFSLPISPLPNQLLAVTLDKLRLQLLEEESRELADSGLPSKISSGAFFRKALEIKNRRYVSVLILRYRYTYRLGRCTLDAKSNVETATVRSRAETLELRNTLFKNLVELRKSQRIYMPGLIPLLDDDESLEELKLLLPSDLSQEDRVVWCLPGIPELEFRFRYAQADDTLTEICHLCRTLQGLRDQNMKHASLSQRGSNRSRSVFEGLLARLRRAVGRYRRSRLAMLALDPSQCLSPRWKDHFQELRDADVRGPGRDPDDKSEGTFQPSWIWLIPQLANCAPDSNLSSAELRQSELPTTTGTGPESEKSVTDAMLTHWAKCQARAERYEEEVLLTVEEMGRTLQYFEWKKLWWISLQFDRAKSSNPPPNEVQQGLCAYALRQAHVYQTLITSFSDRWRKLLRCHALGSEWLCHYPPTPSHQSSDDYP